MSDGHRWAMARTWELDDEQLRAAMAGEWSPDGDGTESGPGCLVCKMTYEEAGQLPCPGRIWADPREPLRRGRAALPRAQRRAERLDEQRRARKARTPERCPHPIDDLRQKGTDMTCSRCGASVALNLPGGRQLGAPRIRSRADHAAESDDHVPDNGTLTTSDTRR